MSAPYYLKGLGDDEERYKLSEARIFHAVMCLTLLKQGNTIGAIELAGSEKQLNAIVLSLFYKEYYHLKEAYEIRKNTGSYWVGWGHSCYSDFEEYAKIRLAQFDAVIERIADKEFIDLAVTLL